MARATHQLTQGRGGCGRTRDELGNAIEGIVLDHQTRGDEGLVGQLTAGLHEVEQRLLHDEVLLEPVALREPIEPFLGGLAADDADAVLVVTPYYNKPSQGGLVAHFTAVAEATDLPVLLYDIPGRTGREIATETLVELAAVDNIVGVKDAVLDLEKTSEVIARTPDDFHLYSGQDSLNLPILAVGGAGFISVAAHLAGRDLAEMAEVFPSDAVKAREDADARKITVLANLKISFFSRRLLSESK
jgi:hypothetical protein